MPGVCAFATRDWELTFNITPYVGVWPLVLVDDLDDTEQILLLEFFQRFSDLLIVVFLGALLGRDSLLLRAMVVIGREGAGFAQALLQTLGGVLENHSVCLLVLGLVEVEIVNDGR